MSSIRALGVALALAAHFSTFAMKPIPAPTTVSTSGVWVGFSKDGRHAFRIDLAADGTGRCAYTASPTVVVACKVRSWSVSDARIHFDAVPIDSVEEAMVMSGSVTHAKIELSLTLRGSSEAWRASYTLFREARLTALTHSMSLHADPLSAASSAPKPENP